MKRERDTDDDGDDEAPLIEFIDVASPMRVSVFWMGRCCSTRASLSSRVLKDTGLIGQWMTLHKVMKRGDSKMLEITSETRVVRLKKIRSKH